MPSSRSIGLLLALLCSFPLVASTYIVNDLGDAADQSAGDDVCDTSGAVCTLRAAIEEANAHAGADVIAFSVAGTIAPGPPLPAITQQVAIDATTAPGYLGAPVVIVSGGGSIATGFDLAAGSSLSEVRGFKIHGFTSAAISVASAGVILRRNYLGPIGGGTANQQGAVLLPSSSSCTIGGTTDGDGNVISGNTGVGLLIGGTDHTLSDNFIGTNAAGTAALANGLSGVELESTTNVSIGAIGTGIENVVSGNGRDGVRVGFCTNTTILNNVLGLNAAGNAAIPNGQAGVRVSGSTATIGTPASGNLISGNGSHGVDIAGGSVVVQNNIVGLDRTGQIAMGNTGDGITSAGIAIIGGSNPGEGNTVSGNRNGVSVSVYGAGTRIYGNTIGLNIDQTAPRGNLSDGIYLGEAFVPDDVRIGEVGGGRNVISGNVGNGIAGAGTNSAIVGNRIGTDGTGNIDLGNGGSGIDTYFVEQITSNLVSGNGRRGVVIRYTSSNLQNNVVRRNAQGGVAVDGDPAIATITQNSIHSNGGIGIDLRLNGVTANDPADADTGPNGLQNFPVIASAVTTGAASWIEGSLNSTPSTLFALHFYGNTAPDPSGFGEGETYLGTMNVMTDAGGNASFVRSDAPLAAGFITATATGPTGTSEFSAVNDVASAPEIHFSTATYTTTEAGGGVTITVVRNGDVSGTSTVDYTTADDTATAGSDYTPSSGTLTFAPGQSSATLDVSILSDGIDEPAERFNLALSNPDAATLTAPSNAVVEIVEPAAVAVPTASTLGLLALILALSAITIMKMR